MVQMAQMAGKQTVMLMAAIMPSDELDRVSFNSPAKIHEAKEVRYWNCGHCLLFLVAVGFIMFGCRHQSFLVERAVLPFSKSEFSESTYM